MMTTSLYLNTDLIRPDFPEYEAYGLLMEENPDGPIDAPEIIPAGSVFKATPLAGWVGRYPIRTCVTRG